MLQHARTVRNAFGRTTHGFVIRPAHHAWFASVDAFRRRVRFASVDAFRHRVRFASGDAFMRRVRFVSGDAFRRRT